jgi:GNAT superfamily N-acetyltransferase
VTPSLTIERATAAELKEVVAILSDAARRIQAKGIDQWPDPYPSERVLPSIERGETYLARVGGRPVATLALQWDDPIFWGEREPDAGYVHRMAVRRDAAGRGYGAQLLEWAEERVAEAGREFLRLDCMQENLALRRYYEEHGFEHRGDLGAGNWGASLYERRVRP